MPTKPSTKDFSIRPFEKLKKKLASKEAATPLQSFPQKKKEISEEELFTDAMNDVQELQDFRKLSTAKSKRSAPPRERSDPEREVLFILSEIAEGRRAIDLPDTQEYVEWKNPDYHSDLTEQMHEGRFSVQAFLDLHGYTVAQAEEELDAFLHDALWEGLRCVKIIHGRGLSSVKGPQLKGRVLKRLSGHFRKDVIAYVSARQCDGGLGALYVLLKKKELLHK